MAGQPTTVEDTDSARSLARLLNSSTRSRPVAVVSTPAGHSTPYIDAADLVTNVGDVVDVYVLPTGPVSRDFSEEMAPLTQVYGGAGRVYPVGVEWVHDPYRSPLRFAFNQAEGVQSTEALVNDALAMALAAGLIGRTASVGTTLRVGAVRGLVAGRAVVHLTTGAFANVVAELTVPGVAIDRLLTSGMDVSGTVDGAGRLDLRGMLRDAAELAYSAGDVVLARVDAVAEQTATLTLHPDVVVAVGHDDVSLNELDDLASLMTPGEVLRARVVDTSPWTLRLRDLEDDETPLEAFALIQGGPPWLEEGLPEIAEIPPSQPPPEALPEPQPNTAPAPVQPPIPPTKPAAGRPATPAIFDRTRASAAHPTRAAEEPAEQQPTLDPVSPRPRPASSTPRRGPAPPLPAAATRLQVDLDSARKELTRTRSELAGVKEEWRLLHDERTKAQARAAAAEQKLAKARKDLRSSRAVREAPPDAGPWFSDPETQFRHEVHDAWVHRILANEKSDLPLVGYAVGDHFLASLGAIAGITRRKIVEVVVEVLTGLDAKLPGRERHPLRTSEGGNSPQRTRADGATCWRVSLQINTPSARRLHYWRLRDGSVELSRVVIHDDVEP